MENGKRYRQKRRYSAPSGMLNVSFFGSNGQKRWDHRAKKTKTVTFSDEVIAMSITENVTPPTEGEKNSPNLPQYQYSREELLKYKDSPLAKIRPECLDPAFNNARGIWDTEKWHFRGNSETPPIDERGVRSDSQTDSHKRRSGDPRERIRKEQDGGIVLSPQRRSFNSGCFVPSSQGLGRRPESPLNKENRDVNHREIPTRRIGSGRIVRNDMWDLRIEKDMDQPSDFPFQRSVNSGASREERTDRRSYGHEYGRGERHRGERNRYGDRRRAYSDSKEVEPEWYSGGPVSQNDTIELRGFEDIPEENAGSKGKKQSTGQNKSGKSTARSSAWKKQQDTSQNQTSSQNKRTPTPPLSSPIIEGITIENSSNKPLSDESWPDSKSDAMNIPGSEFNLDDFLKSDTFPGLLTNGGPAESSGGSRFSQWFRRDSPVNQQAESRRSSLQDELLNTIIGNCDISDPKIVIPTISESNTYFAPISPAANTATITTNSASNNAKSASLLEMLQRGGQGDATVQPTIKPPSIRDLEATGKVHSVEELEAKMMATHNQISAKPATNLPTKDEDMAAFNKLLAQISDGKVIPATHANGSHSQTSQPVNLLQMLNKSQDGNRSTAPQQPSTQDQSRNILSNFNASSQLKPNANTTIHNSSQQQMQIPQDLVMKLLQVQQQHQQQQQQQHQQRQHEMLSKLLQTSQSAQHLGPQFSVPPPSLSPLPPELQVMVNNAQPSNELLQRPEAIAILQGLRYGEITPHHLVQQLQNPAMQNRHREVLVSILKMQMQPGVSTRNTSPHPQAQQPDLLHQMMLQKQQQQHHQQQLRIPSPLNSGLPHRVPSPRELVAHTQHIMQSALIKKKLEEQRENYRKRQEMQQSLSPNLSGNTNNSSKPGEPGSQSKHVSSPTPLAFTPTSVLRKMTAEKEIESNSLNQTVRSITETKTSVSTATDVKSQPASSQAQQRQPIQPNLIRSHPPQSSVTWSMPKPHQGRAIVKGNNNFQYAANVDYQQQMQQPQQRHNMIVSGNNMQRSKMTISGPTQPMVTMPQQFNSLMMMHRPAMTQNTRAQAIQAHLASIQQQQQRNLTPSLQQLLLNQNYNTNRASSKTDSRPGNAVRSQQSQPVPMHQAQNINIGGTADLSTSPTSNQLARWFSPELLAQARAGQLPDIPMPSTQNMLSLEELERLQQSSAAVHN